MLILTWNANDNLNWPPLSFAPPLTPGSTAGCRGRWRSWSLQEWRPVCSEWTDPAAGWAAEFPPGWCWGCAAAPCLRSAAAARPRPAGAVAPLLSAAAWGSDEGDQKNRINQALQNIIHQNIYLWNHITRKHQTTILSTYGLNTIPSFCFAVPLSVSLDARCSL